MAKPSGRSARDDGELAARAAWLHFVGGLTQNEVAARLGISATRAHRAISKAQSMGLVHITVDASAATCVELENALIETYGLDLCRVAMDLPEPEDIPLTALGALGGDWLAHILDTGSHKNIGISHGRTLAAMVEAMRPCEAPEARFVSLLGGLTRSMAANPYDVIHRLAQKTGAEAYLLPAPLFADTRHDRDLLMAQSFITESFARMAETDLAIVGIGDLSTSTSARVVTLGEEELRAEGAAAEILGQFLNAAGEVIATPYDGRTIALPVDQLQGRDVVAIAGGTSKVEAIRATLRSGLLTGLIIDEATARSIVEGLDGEEAVAAE